MKRVTFLNRYFYPDHSATSQLLSDLAFHLASSGRQVRIITSPLRYDNPDAQLLSQEHVNGVQVAAAVRMQDRTSSLCCIGVWGPAARELVGAVADADLSNEALPYSTW